MRLGLGLGLKGTDNYPITAAASFFARLQSSLAVERAYGSGTPTFTRATVATVTDFEGRIVPVVSGEARFQGARRVRNYITASEDFSNPAWGTLTGVTLTGTNTLTFASGNSNEIAQYPAMPNIVGGTANKTFTISAKVYTLSGTKAFRLENHQDLVGTAWSDDLTATTTPQIFSFTHTFGSSAGSGATVPGIRNDSAGTAGTIVVEWIQLEDVTGQSVRTFGGYVSTSVLSAPYHGAGVDGVKYFSTLNGNTVSSNVVTEAQGAPISSATCKNGQLSGATSAYFYTPFSTANNITDDLCMTFDLALDSVAPSDYRVIVSTYTAGSQGWSLSQWSAANPGKIYFDYNGSSYTSTATLASVEIADRQRFKLRVFRDKTNSRIRFYYSTDGGTTFTQLGADVSATSASMTRGTNALCFGAHPDGTTANTCRFYGVQIATTLGGTPVVDFNPNDYTNGGSWVSGSTGEWWYLNGTAKVFGADDDSYTNSCLRSQAHATAPWNSEGSVTVTNNAAIAPDGTTTASEITLAAGGLGVSRFQNVTVTNGTASVWLKGTAGQQVYLTLNGGGPLASRGTAEQTLVTLTSDWVRYSITPSTGATDYTSLTTDGYGANASLPGVTFYAWGHQVSTDADAAYIPTTSAAVTVYGIPAPWDAYGPFGYLAEGARTNLKTYSQAFDTLAGNWNWQNTSVVADQAIAPDGTLTADALYENGVNAQHNVYGPATLTNGVFTASCFLKYGNRQYVSLWIENGAQATFDLINGTVTSAKLNGTGTYTASGIIPYPNGWYRCWFSGTKAAGIQQFAVDFANNSSDPTLPVTYAGNASNYVYAWGYDVEDTVTFPSTYIPTTSAAVTRAADVLTYATSGNFAWSPGGTVSAEVTTEWITDTSIDHEIVNMYPAVSTGQLYVRTGDNKLATYDGVTEVVGAVFTGSASIQKVANSWMASANSSVLFADDGTVTTSAATFNGAPATHTAFAVGAQTDGANRAWFGTIRNVRVWTRTLSTSQLESVTA